MQMPGGRSSRGPSLGVIDALLTMAVIAMAFASFFMYQAAVSVAPGGDVTKVQEAGNIRLGQ
jgi:hypothetical protein